MTYMFMLKCALKLVLKNIQQKCRSSKFFNYLGNLICYEIEADVDNKLNKYFKITNIINNVFRPQKTLKKTRIKLYSTLSLPALLHRSENWTIKARDARRITAAE